MKNQYEIDYQQGYDNANEEWLERMDKIKEDIKRLKHQNTDMASDHWWNNAIDNCLHEIDKYKPESEE